VTAGQALVALASALCLNWSIVLYVSAIRRRIAA
jgi:hypothetical protein